MNSLIVIFCAFFGIHNTILNQGDNSFSSLFDQMVAKYGLEQAITEEEMVDEDNELALETTSQNLDYMDPVETDGLVFDDYYEEDITDDKLDVEIDDSVDADLLSRINDLSEVDIDYVHEEAEPSIGVDQSVDYVHGENEPLIDIDQSGGIAAEPNDVEVDGADNYNIYPDIGEASYLVEEENEANNIKEPTIWVGMEGVSDFCLSQDINQEYPYEVTDQKDEFWFEDGKFWVSANYNTTSQRIYTGFYIYDPKGNIYHCLGPYRKNFDGQMRFFAEVDLGLAGIFGWWTAEFLINEQPVYRRQFYFGCRIAKPNKPRCHEIQDGVMIEWDPVPNATTYSIYRNSQLIKQVLAEADSTVDDEVRAGDNCYYQIRAVRGNAESVISEPTGFQSTGDGPLINWVDNEFQAPVHSYRPPFVCSFDTGANDFALFNNTDAVIDVHNNYHESYNNGSCLEVAIDRPAAFELRREGLVLDPTKKYAGSIWVKSRTVGWVSIGYCQTNNPNVRHQVALIDYRLSYWKQTKFSFEVDDLVLGDNERLSMYISIGGFYNKVMIDDLRIEPM